MPGHRSEDKMVLGLPSLTSSSFTATIMAVKSSVLGQRQAVAAAWSKTGMEMLGNRSEEEWKGPSNFIKVRGNQWLPAIPQCPVLIRRGIVSVLLAYPLSLAQPKPSISWENAVYSAQHYCNNLLLYILENHSDVWEEQMFRKDKFCLFLLSLSVLLCHFQ